MLRDAWVEGDREQKRQGLAFIFIATAVVNQAEAEATDEAWKSHNLKDNNWCNKASQLRLAGKNIMSQP